MNTGKKELKLNSKVDLSFLDDLKFINSLKMLKEDKKVELKAKLSHIITILESSKTCELSIPISLFENSLSALELVVRYLHDEHNLSFAQIAQLINRSQKNIWLSYQRSLNKHREKLQISESDYSIPVSRFANLRLSMLENTVCYLHEVCNLNFSKIAAVLHRNQKTVWTVYSRVKKKSNE